MTDMSVGKRVELTLRGLVLGCLITFVFTAANVYLGLRIGLTFATKDGKISYRKTVSEARALNFRFQPIG